MKIKASKELRTRGSSLRMRMTYAVPLLYYTNKNYVIHRIRFYFLSHYICVVLWLMRCLGGYESEFDLWDDIGVTSKDHSLRCLIYWLVVAQ